MPNWVTNILTIHGDSTRVHEILNAIKHDEGNLGSFDFNKLIPMPKDLDLTEGSITDQSIEAYLSRLILDAQKAVVMSDMDRKAISDYCHAASRVFGRSFFQQKPNIHLTEQDIANRAEKNDMTVDAFLALGKKYLDNQMKYGAPTWYHWCTENWGTKWNLGVTDCELVDNKTLSFLTAWSCPDPVIAALSSKFPDIEFVIQWADEDLGNNVGFASYKAGDIIDDYVPEPYSKEAYELAFEIECAGPEDFSMTYSETAGTYVYSEELESEEVNEDLPDLQDQLEAAEDRRLQEADANDPHTVKEPER